MGGRQGGEGVREENNHRDAPRHIRTSSKNMLNRLIPFKILSLIIVITVVSRKGVREENCHRDAPR